VWRGDGTGLRSLPFEGVSISSVNTSVSATVVFMCYIHTYQIVKITNLTYVNCEILGSHSGKYEDDSILGYSAVWCQSRPSSQRCVLPPSSGQ
jgi:hypothetical protein